MTHLSRIPMMALHLALAIWAVALPLLPGPSLAADEPPAETDSCHCCRGETEAAPRCGAEVPVPCASTGSCSRCPLGAGSLVFLAPDRIGLHRSEPYAPVRPEDQSPREAFYETPERPPQPAVLS